MCYKVSTPKKYKAEEAYAYANPYAEWNSTHDLANGFGHDLIPAVVYYKDAYRFIDFEMGLLPRSYSNVQDLKQHRVKTINARSETVFETYSFKESILQRRCLVIIDGYYESHTINPKFKIPYFFTLKDREVFALAGIWDVWKHPSTGETIRSCSIITTTPNAISSVIHNKVDESGNPNSRMPVILHKEDEKVWLDPMLDREGMTTLFKPYPDELMSAVSVNKIANSNKGNDVPEAKQFVPYLDSPIPANF